MNGFMCSWSGLVEPLNNKDSMLESGLVDPLNNIGSLNNKDSIGIFLNNTCRTA